MVDDSIFAILASWASSGILGILGPRHYLLLNQGTFDLWHLSGLETSFVSNVSLGLTKKVDATWNEIVCDYCDCNLHKRTGSVTHGMALLNHEVSIANLFSESTACIGLICFNLFQFITLQRQI